MSKTRIIDLLGEKALLLPELLNQAIVANERAKYLLGLLQMAAAHADAPDSEATTLRSEREACGVAESWLDHVAARSDALGADVYHIPDAARLIAMLSQALDVMLAPLALVEDIAPARQCLLQRKTRLFNAIPPIEGDVLHGETIAALTSGRPAAGDGVHLLVMDLHKKLNRLQEQIADEDVEGARCYGLTDGDRPLVAAFMRGLHRTAALKFDHPGLATTAARNGETLLIQNDIGETDAHVLVLQVTGLTATLTYSDVHAQRLRFLQDTLATSGIAWEETRSRQATGLAHDDLFYIATGKLAATEASALSAFLEQLGSRLVFLIDWNRARKRLGRLVPNALAVELLQWAAEHELGHRAFLQLGGERLIYDALEQSVRTPLRYGEELHEMIGLEAARGFLRFVLATAATGLRDDCSQMLIRDRIRAELFGHFRSADQRLCAEGARHAAIIVRLAQGLCDALRTGEAPGGEAFARNAERAKGLETQADDIVRTVRSTAQRIAGTEIFRRIVETADDAADGLEEAAFLCGVSVNGGVNANAELAAPLIALAQLVLEGARSYQRTLEAAPLVHRTGDREPVQHFLEAADRVVSVEHQTDQHEREVTAALMAGPIDCRQLYLVDAITRHLEEGADSLMRATLTLRDHVMGEVMFE